MLTPRTQLFATYQTGLGTDLQEIQSLVAASGVDQFGNVVDSQTGAPLFIGNPGIGVQGNGTLNQTRSFTAGATTALDRDTFSVAVSATDKAVASSTVLEQRSRPQQGHLGQCLLATPGQRGRVDHRLLRLRRANQPFFFVVAPNQNSNQTFFGASASYRYAFSETLSGLAQYGSFRAQLQDPGPKLRAEYRAHRPHKAVLTRSGVREYYKFKGSRSS